MAVNSVPIPTLLPDLLIVLLFFFLDNIIISVRVHIPHAHFSLELIFKIHLAK